MKSTRVQSRREFVKRTSLLTALSTLAGSAFGALEAPPLAAGKPFRLNYAPHDGMFKNHAGADFIDQIKFMADQGFRGIEDNGLLSRSIEYQERIGKTLAQLNMTMGVFVVDGGDNWKISLTSGKQEFKDNFVKTCKASVEAAKRVNAKWATVVPGFFDRRLPIGIQTTIEYRRFAEALKFLNPMD